ncbi:hypothetical protein HU736_015640 [Pseudomonas sp. SWRI56]|nr:hypothetical protein [Pseudomonas shirazensis]MBV4502052.1 hypothetical protein [Pseudomonas shirazensis]
MTTVANASTELSSAYRLIASKTPTWLSQASPSVHSAMRKALANPPPWLSEARLQQPDIVKALAEQRALSQDAAEVAQLFRDLPSVESTTRASWVRCRFTTRWSCNLNGSPSYAEHWMSAVNIKHCCRLSTSRRALPGAGTGAPRPVPRPPT